MIAAREVRVHFVDGDVDGVELAADFGLVDAKGRAIGATATAWPCSDGGWGVRYAATRAGQPFGGGFRRPEWYESKAEALKAARASLEAKARKAQRKAH